MANEDAGKCEVCGTPHGTLWMRCSKCGTRLQKFSDFRYKIIDIVVKQAQLGANWKEICKDVLLLHDILPEEIEAELERRKGGDSPPNFYKLL
jgi:hypothetical protein